MLNKIRYDGKTQRKTFLQELFFGFTWGASHFYLKNFFLGIVRAGLFWISILMIIVAVAVKESGALSRGTDGFWVVIIVALVFMGLLLVWWLFLLVQIWRGTMKDAEGTAIKFWSSRKKVVEEIEPQELVEETAEDTVHQPFDQPALLIEEDHLLEDTDPHRITRIHNSKCKVHFPPTHLREE
ncbi:hypothetical protein [Mesomycoplasma hyorhinis]|uniref:hypothetical protein n=1 Tax=Mesomycoplasma hyorhinis TaxID=2100 RepID=UPI00037F7146|nr:hypothetical protein [Mesomycoplasma hyorhinis]QPC29681.1 hypothetical protein ISX88_00160 [Mesomycoplasma hyorhinis]